jgi:RPA family protein
MKKQLAIVVIGTVILGGIAINRPDVIEHVTPQIVEKTVEVTVPETEKRIKEAQEAQKDTIEAEAQKAYDATKQKMLTEIELDVTRQIREELEAREAELQDQVSL